MKKLYLAYIKAVLIFTGISLFSILIHILIQWFFGLSIPIFFMFVIGSLNPMITGIYLILEWEKLKTLLSQADQESFKARNFVYVGVTLILFSIISFFILLSA